MTRLLDRTLDILKSRGHSINYEIRGQKVYFDDGSTFLLKSSPNSAAEQMIGEAKSLIAMDKAFPGICPKLIDSSLNDDDSDDFWMLTEYHDFGSTNSSHMQNLGKSLAKMHLNGVQPQGKFGFEMPTYCGETKFKNEWHDNWVDFLNNDRFNYLLEQICGDTGVGDMEIWELGQKLMSKVVPDLLGNIKVKPCIQHGDLWAGNAAYSNTTKRPVIFDACSFYGHNEAELGICRMFGGFGNAFFDAYHSVYPKAEPIEEYVQRQDLYELIHHLNHYAIFGSMYRSGALNKMRRLVKYVESKN